MGWHIKSMLFPKINVAGFTHFLWPAPFDVCVLLLTLRLLWLFLASRWHKNRNQTLTVVKWGSCGQSNLSLRFTTKNCSSAWAWNGFKKYFLSCAHQRVDGNIFLYEWIPVELQLIASLQKPNEYHPMNIQVLPIFEMHMGKHWSRFIFFHTFSCQRSP